MRKYNFRLSQVQRIRRTQEDVAKAALLEANHGVQTALEELAVRHATYEAIVAAPPAGATCMEDFIKRRYFSELAREAVGIAEQQVGAARIVAEQRKAEWMTVASQVKVLERLDERHRAEYEIEAGRDLEAEMDDIVTGRFGINEAARLKAGNA